MWRYQPRFTFCIYAPSHCPKEEKKFRRRKYSTHNWKNLNLHKEIFGESLTWWIDKLPLWSALHWKCELFKGIDRNLYRIIYVHGKWKTISNCSPFWTIWPHDDLSVKFCSIQMWFSSSRYFYSVNGDRVNIGIHNDYSPKSLHKLVF